ncbi:alanine--tRNA ligase [Aureispira anguillae]|uniref:Alanine--tRNA ligase n=2 Tax=Aureispira anguillae TaxID=2864201 RepID=A0A916DWE0_9BACT|nr:alanine--tRNA ligase [Aureispira anguillae]
MFCPLLRTIIYNIFEIMMTVKEIRQKFLDFFESKDHKIVPSAPIVNQNDPTLMFMNSGMAQFKDYFLGNQIPSAARIADTQKCLRVSGKHNDLEDVGRDSYHQTMFEMLGNWSFGDYFKEEAIEWAWELLTEVYKMDKDRLYVTIFEGDEKDKVAADEEAFELWQKWVPKDRILRAGKKDNFWEMGAQGPCGPCSEIHIDIRSDEERAKLDGKELVNQDHPLVIEIWNLVFMQFNRLADGSLVPLAKKCIDTGMGLERVCMALQGKESNYDTDVFSPLIQLIEKESGKKYTGSYEKDADVDIAMRVIADHVRAVALVIADGCQPNNTGAGYVVRRVLRRAVRYYYSFLDIKAPFIYKLIPTLSASFAEVFPEVKAQEKMLMDTIKGEEASFLRTLERGLKLFAGLEVNNKEVTGKDAFLLFDTFGFPFDLTRLLAEEKGWTVDEKGFEAALVEQKKRSQKDAQKDVSDWVEILEDPTVEFVGYTEHKTTAKVIKYRKVVAKGKEQYQVVLNKTPFYAEAGGQVGDTGLLWFGDEKIPVIDTKKENNLIVHWVKQLPQQIEVEVVAEINRQKRALTEKNHSVAHLAHAALRQVLGTHVQQKGSFVSPDKMRFDFSHTSKMTEEQIREVEEIVNDKIRANISLVEQANVPIDEARESGAMMLFGEKYGESVRIITFEEGFSKELCGGCHVKSTGEIGWFKLVTETSIASGIRRIEALTGAAAVAYVQDEMAKLSEIRALLKNPKNLAKALQDLLDTNKKLTKELDKMAVLEAQMAKDQLKQSVVKIGGLHFLGTTTSIVSKDGLKQLSNGLSQEFDNLVLVLGGVNKGKALLTVAVDKNVVDNYNLKAGDIIKAVAKEIQGGGGGQPVYATAGGKNPEGLNQAIAAAKELIEAAV